MLSLPIPLHKPNLTGIYTSAPLLLTAAQSHSVSPHLLPEPMQQEQLDTDNKIPDVAAVNKPYVFVGVGVEALSLPLFNLS